VGCTAGTAVREPKIPNHLPQDAKSLITGLLHKKPERRLQGPKLRSHLFFFETDWGAMERLEIEPPFKPELPEEHEGHFFKKFVRGMFG